MKKLAIIGANEFQNRLILKAKELGYETHVFAWEDGAVGKETADYFYPINIVEKEKILEICKKIKPVGVCSIASDLAVITVNYVAEKLGLPCNQTMYSSIQTNKYEMRRALTDAGIDCPKFVKVDNEFNSEIIKNFRFPIIVKPTDRSGSRCVTMLETIAGIEEAVAAACEVSFEKAAIIEEFIDGDEYSMETITQNGIHHYLATTKKYTTGAPHFIETGHEEPSGLSEEIINKAKGIVFKALTALHIENSAGHSEFKIDKSGNIRIIEIGARMGGDCIGSDLVYLSTGNDFTKMVIDVAVGAGIEPICDINNSASIYFLFDNEDFAKMNDTLNDFPDSVYSVSEINYDIIGKATDSSTRAGYYICIQKRK